MVGSKEKFEIMKLNASGFYLAVVALMVLAVWMVWGDNGFNSLVGLREEKARILEKTREIEAENRGIENIIARLQHDGTYIEHLAKHGFGLARKEEFIFRFASHAPASKDTGAEVTMP
jgi:cell division protein FtsB